MRDTKDTKDHDFKIMWPSKGVITSFEKSVGKPKLSGSIAKRHYISAELNKANFKDTDEVMTLRPYNFEKTL